MALSCHSMDSLAQERAATALLTAARRALAIEARALEALQQRVDTAFIAACRLCLDCHGRVVVTGMGKSGHVARKIAATLASTGTPAFFLHPAEASHGDIGMITRQDLLLALSNSGETPELSMLLPHLARLGTPLIAMTGNPGSTLARNAAVHLDVSVPEEACPLNLAPTASTTAALAMGDALAVALLEARGFTAEDFARSHPGGSLGRRLLLHVEDVMRRGSDMPQVGPTTPLSQGLLEMSRKGLGMTVVVGEDAHVLGIFTDGDLRRMLDARIDVHTATMQDVMTRGCHTIGPRELAAEAVHVMETRRISALPVVDAAGTLVGALNVHDLLRAGVV
ncbi:MAG: KpsF/GutQ family sugar-phosphate isomerase [Sinobacteraceae bacterium]|nr:KpsF/GutQ family sugar-phosphate isomerase [Nevskiaceae bacterium]MCP5466292.1 KpsF/GutQ family sugar-phosphate isomerase [Nevskiaceae bacterium]